MVVICNKPYPSNSEYQPHFDMFPYPLSDFQKYAIEAVVTGRHALVTAHTGSGKSLPAEFAIQYFHSLGKKTIYTSPIKALSNQKYYEFLQKYPHIQFGLITGDIKINPTADVLIMTAEILLNYLFTQQAQGTTAPSAQASFQIDIHTELACVVMDEIHYINDRDRGAVWEKTILSLPPHVQMVMLSATIDSPERFAQWCERSITDSVYLSTTETRIVPLVHYGFLTTTETFFKKVRDKAVQQQMRDSTNRLITLKDAAGKYQPTGYLELKTTKRLLETNEVRIQRSHVLNQLCVFLKDRDMFPAIAFVFSRKNVEVYAKEITANLLEDDSKIPYIVSRECEQIVRKLPNYREYLELPEYRQLVALLEKGVGIHHSGMIPVLREIVELMISKRYIKLLFATESFAIGLNCPIRTAVFTALQKFDGAYERLLLPHEYNQAASRCGRRGIDTIGHVVHCVNLFDMPADTEYRELLCGKPQKLVSKFRISMPMILTILGTSTTNGGEGGGEGDGEPASKKIRDFVEKSMVFERIQESRRTCQDHIATIEDNIERHTAGLKYLRTPIETCKEYYQLQVLAPTLVNKKRKEAERKMQQIATDHRHIKEDVAATTRGMELELELERARRDLETIENHIAAKVQRSIEVLELVGFLEHEKPTKKGRMAAILSEVNPIVMSDFLEHTNYMENLATPIQIIRFLSCFVDVKVAQDTRLSVPSQKDSHVHAAAAAYQVLLDLYISYERDYGVSMSNNGADSDLEMCYDLMDIIGEWCDAADESQCKWFIQTRLAEKAISIGDFTKAILKISTITRELMNLCEQNELYELLSKLAAIDGLILKYITTAQSLYV